MIISRLTKRLDKHLKAHLKGVSRTWTDNIVGNSGVGKTYLAKFLATSNDCALIKVSVAQLEIADLIGTPMPVQIRPNVWVQQYALPNWLPHIRVDENGDEMYHTFDDGIERPLIDLDLLGAKVENKKDLQKKLGKEWKDKVKGVVIFLDEINRTPDDQMKNGIFEFIENGRLHTYESPWNTYRITAMNPPSLKYFVNDMTDEKAFMSRMCHYILEATKEDWLNWAEERGIVDLIREFVSVEEDALTEKEDPIQLKIRRTPRGYEMLHVLIAETDFPAEADERLEIYEGTIGKTYGKKLADYEAKRHVNIPSPLDILHNYENLRDSLNEIKEKRNDFHVVLNNYVLAFLNKEENAKTTFYSSEDAAKILKYDDYEKFPYVTQVMENFKSFVGDMFPSSRSTFIRKLSSFPHISSLLANDMDIYDLVAKELEDAENNTI